MVFLPLIVAFDLYGGLRRQPQWHGLGYFLLVLGTISALVAVLTRTAAGASGIYIERHKDLATIVSVLFLVVVIGRLDDWRCASGSPPPRWAAAGCA